MNPASAKRHPAAVTTVIDGIAALLREGLKWDYVVDAGRWVPAHDNRIYPDWAPNTPGTAGAAPCTTEA